MITKNEHIVLIICHTEQLGARGAELETAKEQLAKILFVPFFGVVSCDVLSKIKS